MLNHLVKNSHNMNRYTDALKEYTILLSEQANLYTTLKGLRESIERQIENGCNKRPGVTLGVVL